MNIEAVIRHAGDFRLSLETCAFLHSRTLLSRDSKTMKREKQENGISEEDVAQSKPKRLGARCVNLFKLRRGEKDADGKCEVPLVDFESDAAKPSTSFVYENRALESSEIITPVSPQALKLFEAIREDEMDLVEAELASLTDKSEIDKIGGHGFTLIHVAARRSVQF